MPFIPHWSLRTIEHKEQIALVSSRAHKAWNLAGLCLEIIPIPPSRCHSLVLSAGVSNTSPSACCPCLPQGHSYWLVVLQWDRNNVSIAVELSNLQQTFLPWIILGGLIPPGTSILTFAISKILTLYWKMTSNLVTRVCTLHSVC